jgi:hypothetical protein
LTLGLPLVCRVQAGEQKQKKGPFLFQLEGWNRADTLLIYPTLKIQVAITAPYEKSYYKAVKNKQSLPPAAFSTSGMGGIDFDIQMAKVPSRIASALAEELRTSGFTPIVGQTIGEIYDEGTYITSIMETDFVKQLQQQGSIVIMRKITEADKNPKAWKKLPQEQQDSISRRDRLAWVQEVQRRSLPQEARGVVFVDAAFSYPSYSAEKQRIDQVLSINLGAVLIELPSGRVQSAGDVLVYRKQQTLARDRYLGMDRRQGEFLESSDSLFLRASDELARCFPALTQEPKVKIP